MPRLRRCLILFIGADLVAPFSATYQTGVGRRVVALADGSMLSLDASTRVDVRYLGDRRELWLRSGRAKFVVAKDPLRLFGPGRRTDGDRHRHPVQRRAIGRPDSASSCTSASQ